MNPRWLWLMSILGRLVYLAGTSLAIWLIGGGVSFGSSSIGPAYLILWNVWWLVTFMGRQRGIKTPYDHKQRIWVILSGSLSVPFLIIVPPWEFSSFSGPIPRAGLTAWIGLLLFALGIILQSIAMWQLRSFYTVRLNVRECQPLVKTGAYRWVRHPGYLSYLVSILGIGLAMSSLAVLALDILIFIFIHFRIKNEEMMLLEVFRKQYDDYAKRTRKLLPFIY
jgi:protein-S-isoprenylcysteine O-methyltransferase Ste14